jgi:DNA repair protein RadA/Sms
MVSSDKLQLSAENQIERIVDYVSLLKPEMIIIDSIQTMFTPGIDSLPGSPNQVRECGQKLLQLSKQKELTIIIIGHVTKDGIIAGPKMLEHMVDTVLYLEGDDRYEHRILRSVKNRFGATNEVGIFLMSSKGLQEVKNPSELFLEERTKNVAGTAIYASLEGTRPILVEVQALVSPANFGTPQRNVNGFDFKRLSMLLAVLEKRMKIIMGAKDVFVNLVGGLKINDPAADLSIISTVASSSREKPIDPGIVLIGEVGLAGEVRSVSQVEKRIQEAKTLGFTIAIVPKSNERTLKPRPKGISIKFVSTVKETFNILF